MALEQLNLVLLIGAAVLLSAILAVRLSHRAGMPSLLAYLGLGLLLGQDVLGIQFSDAQLAQDIGLTALAIILAEGGLTTNWSHVRASVPIAAVLATFGVVVNTALIALAAHFVFGAGWQLALLIGAVLSPTDAAAVFSVLRNLPLPPRVAGALEAESGFNDAPVVILVVLLSTPGGGFGNPALLVGLVAYELAAGGAIGCLVGVLGAYALRRIALPASGLYPLAVLALSVGAYAVADVAHASGFLAVYLAGVILGNARLPHRPATRGFAEGLAWLAQIGLFVMLGLLATPSRLTGAIGAALLLGAILLLVTRPLSVLASAVWFRVPWRQQAFLSWAGLRGAVPIVLATVPLTTGFADAQRLFDLVFVLVGVLTIVQGPTLPWVSRLLRTVTSDETLDLDVEAAPLEGMGAELLQLRIPPRSRLHGVEVFELRLPEGATVTLIVREGRSFTPNGSTALLRGDQLLIVTTRDAREATERRLRAVSRRGKLARWHGERGQE